MYVQGMFNYSMWYLYLYISGLDVLHIPCVCRLRDRKEKMKGWDLCAMILLQSLFVVFLVIFFRSFFPFLLFFSSFSFIISCLQGEGKEKEKQQ